MGRGAPVLSEHFYDALTPPAKQSPQAAVRTQPRIERMSSERWRMESSLLLSLLIHGLLLSLTFSGQGRGLPSLKLPWQERRVEVPELRVLLVPAPAPRELAAVNSGAEPAQQASIEPPVAGGRAPAPPASPAPLRGRALEIAPAGKPKAEAQPQRNAVAASSPAKDLLVPVSPPVTQCPQRSPRRPRSTWRRPAGPSWSVLPLQRGQM